MARYTGPSCKLCRREGTKLYLKGERCLSDKCALNRRTSAPGQHGAAKKKMTEYGMQLRDAGHAVLLVSLELDEVMNLSDRILVIYEGEIVAEVKPKETTMQELGLFMSGAKRNVGENNE